MSGNVCAPSLTVDSFFKRPFSTRPYAEKLAIVRGGRPQPALNSLLSTHQEQYRKSTNNEKPNEYILQFQTTHYDRVPWLTGSEKKNKLYCWPCLLFSAEKSMWNTVGYSHLRGIINAFQKHDRSQNHVASVVAYKTFGAVSPDKPNQLMDEEFRRIDEHNAKVRKNQELLHRMIEVVCFISKQELPLRGQCPGTSRNNFVEALKLISVHVPLLKTYLESCKECPETIERIEDDLDEALVYVMSRSDVDVAKYVSLVLDETTDTTGRSQLATVLRYVTSSGETCERLVHFDDVTDKSATESFECVYKTACELKLKEKLIAHSYATTTARDVDGLSAKLLESFPKAPFVHCHDHTLNVVLQQSLYHMKRCRLFFQTLDALATFFEDSPRRVDNLCAFMWRRFDAKIHADVWRRTSRLVITVHRYRYELIEFFKEFLDEQNGRDAVDNAVVMARAFLASFTSFDFRFLLIVLASLFEQTDALCRVLRTKSFDVECCVAKMVATVAAIRADVVRYDTVWTQVLRDTLEGERRRGGKARLNDDSRKESYRCFYCDIVEAIAGQIEHRFRTLESHVFIGLVNPDMFDVHAKKFPEDMFTNLLQTRNTLFDFSRLRNELVNLYRMKQFSGKPPGELMFFLRDMDLKETMPELYRLCSFVLTVPSTCPSVEPTFSALKRIRRHACAVGTNRLTNRSLLAIESALLNRLKNKAGFYEDVTSAFIRHGDKDEFTYIVQKENKDEFACKSYF